MPLLIGLTLAILVGIFARRFGLDRDRAFYPTVTIVIASYYVLFGAMAASPAVLACEIVMGGGFVALALFGFKRSLWFVVVALGAHGIFDFFHPHLVLNRGVPGWWPDFCMAYDIAAAAVLGWRLSQGSSANASNKPIPENILEG